MVLRRDEARKGLELSKWLGLVARAPRAFAWRPGSLLVWKCSVQGRRGPRRLPEETCLQ